MLRVITYLTYICWEIDNFVIKSDIFRRFVRIFLRNYRVTMVLPARHVCFCMHVFSSNALKQPYFDYCSPLWGLCNKTLRDNLQKFQNRAARIIVGASYEIRSADVLRTLDWENLETRWYLTKPTFLYKVLIKVLTNSERFIHK